MDVPHETDNAACVMPSFRCVRAVVDPRLVEMLEVEDVDFRIASAGLVDALCIICVVVPFGLAAADDVLSPHVIPQIFIKGPYRLVGLWVNRPFVDLGMAHRAQDAKQKAKVNKSFHIMWFEGCSFKAAKR